MGDRWRKRSSLGQPALFSRPGVCRPALLHSAPCTPPLSNQLHRALEPSRKAPTAAARNTGVTPVQLPSLTVTSSSVSPCRQWSLWTNCCEKWTQPKTGSYGSESTRQATFAPWTWRSRCACVALGVLLRRGAGGPMEKGCVCPMTC